MYHPTTRLLTVLEMLQSHHQISGTDLATRLEVDKRTIRRYIMMLQDLGIPVEAEPGRYGGYSLRPGYKLPPLMFTEGEALALTLSLMAGQTLGLDAAVPAMEGALAKIERVMPAPIRERVRALQRVLVLDGGPPDTLVRMKILGTLSLASHQGRRVRMRYQSGTETITERLLDPYGIVSHAGRWYTAGFCHLRGAIRVFRLDRVLSAEPREEKFAPPPDFDSLSYVLNSFANIPDRWTIRVVLTGSLEVLQPRVPREFAILSPHPDGVLLQAMYDDLDSMARFLVNLGCKFTVQEPPELRQALKALAEELLAIAAA